VGKKKKRQPDKRTGVQNPSILRYGLIIPPILSAQTQGIKGFHVESGDGVSRKPTFGANMKQSTENQTAFPVMPGVVYFVMLKVAQQVLPILLDAEANSRRAARK